MAIRIGVVGLGFGSEFVPIYLKHPDVATVAICDADEGKLHELGNRFGIESRFTKLEQMLEADSCDAVHILTPVPLHVPQSLAVLNSGRHCACAVPMATDLEGIRKVISATRRSGKNYMMMETTAYDRACIFVRDKVRSGEMGNLTFLRGTYFQDLEGSYPTYWRAMPPMLYATHAVAPLLSIAGTRARKVFCLGSGKLGPTIQQPGANTFPLQTAIFRLDGTDVAAEVTRSWFQTARPYTEAFSVYGDAAGFEWQQVESEEPVLYEMQQPVADQRGREVTARRYLPPLRPDLYPAELAEFADGWHGGSHPHLAHEFVRSIVEDRPPAIDEVTSADWTAPGICANESSLREGEPVAIPRY